MPARTPCVHCGVTGFVRWEHVIAGTRSSVDYFCGACERSWSVADTDGQDPVATTAGVPGKPKPLGKEPEKP